MTTRFEDSYFGQLRKIAGANFPLITEGAAVVVTKFVDGKLKILMHKKPCDDRNYHLPGGLLEIYELDEADLSIINFSSQRLSGHNDSSGRRCCIESSVETAIRELREETGLIVSSGDLVEFGRREKSGDSAIATLSNGDHCVIRTTLFHAEAFAGQLKAEAGEIASLEWVNLDDCDLPMSDVIRSFVAAFIRYHDTGEYQWLPVAQQSDVRRAGVKPHVVQPKLVVSR